MLALAGVYMLALAVGLLVGLIVPLYAVASLQIWLFALLGQIAVGAAMIAVWCKPRLPGAR